ncbi:MAG: A/G-specific adenine glycosylase [Polaromonas sp.]|uniref:A/G-specific adenine glycosylase n=1 Tax=Polaromonas sp. TaxID=1869339 RepID=UPI00272FD5A0|nr:A/G-specific adenine glycosylase [Polaromonas sp.]MDP2256490.1 A/G-specific adenine glycosylase [Polaromonas sp.]
MPNGQPAPREGDKPAIKPSNLSGLSSEIVRWQKTHGRNSLPWQNTRDPYRVWLSEIMLQQTQVATVLDYYARFLLRFPAVSDLAAAAQDEVMALWSGLGYYSRARNLHRCAQDVMVLHAGQFPRTAEQLQSLPGIGRSTAAAIASFCFGERVAILDGNAKRVLARVIGFSADLAQSGNERALWDMATDLLPDQDLPEVMPRYTQGLMDLGATICLLRQPQCLQCPVQKLCRGFATGEPGNYPVKTRKLKRSAQALSLLWAQKPDGSVWLEKRPTSGIWGGLYCLPVFESDDALKAHLPQPLHARLEALPHFVHVLTHKDLHLSPWIAGFQAAQAMPKAISTDASAGAWFSALAWPGLGLPAPIRKLLAQDASL